MRATRMKTHCLVTVWGWFLVGLRLACAGDLTFDAVSFDKGNVLVSQPGQVFADGPSCIRHAESLTDQVDYFIDFPVDGDYALSALYASPLSRPVDIMLDDTLVLVGFKGTTEGWNTRTARWEKQGVLKVAAGTRKLTLRRKGLFPHICSLQVDSLKPLPEGRALQRAAAERVAAMLKEDARRQQAVELRQKLDTYDIQAVGRAFEDLERNFPGRFDSAAGRQALAVYGRERDTLRTALDKDGDVAVEPFERALAGVRAALLSNPLLDFDRLLALRRNFSGDQARQLTDAAAGFTPAAWQNAVAVVKRKWDNELVLLTGLRGVPKVETLFKPENGSILRDLCLDFSGERLLFSSRAETNRWGVHEISLADRQVRHLTPTNYADVDFFDACYLPNGKVVVCSTAGYQGIPCVSGVSPSSGLYLLDPSAQTLRQLTFDQDNDYHPRVLNDGRVLYLRWEYSDIPHYFSRRLMTMNPDGTGQLALYGSNGWFPTGFRFARPVPGKTTILAGIISGHHECGEFGRMALLDPALATHYPFRFHPASKSWGARETEMPERKIWPPPPENQLETPFVLIPELLPAEQTGWLQLIPGYGKTVAGVVCDIIMRDYYAKQAPVLTVSAGGLPTADGDFYRNVTRNTILTTHPYPLSDKYFLVSQKNRDDDLWGIYLVDVFDNATLIVETENAALFEPLPLLARERPPVIPDRVIPESKTADVHIADIYAGPGLRGVPRGVVSRLRVFSYHFGYNNKAGPSVVGTQSGWDMKRILGTATVEEDGSAHFQIPANTPVSIQPLDRNGQAIQLMRSWLVGMPGERVSCVGCHEGRSSTLPLQRSLASRRPAEALEPWFGPPRPFAFATEVYPVLAKSCVGCHSDDPRVGPTSKPSLKDADRAYDGLRPYAHVPSMESDMALLTPMEYHASTSPLVQMLRKGHHGVTWAALGSEARERITCWIDLNAPKRGVWGPPDHAGHDQVRRRRELAERFASVNDDPEAEGQVAAERMRNGGPIQFMPPPAEEPVSPDGLKAPGYPLSADAARSLQASSGPQTQRTLDLGGGISMPLVRIPGGVFVMGSLEGSPDERPRAVVNIEKAFWMGVCEVNNAQYAAFDAAHDTRYVDMHGINRVTPGYIANHPEQPVARVSWEEAMRFCEWLSQRTGVRVTLPTEAQWEWAARAGTDTPFFYGTHNTDYSRFANLADRALRWFDTQWEGRGSLLQKRYPYAANNSSYNNLPLRDERFMDNWFVVDYCGQTEANVWGLKDMVGNVSEWTRTDYRDYPYAEADGRSAGGGSVLKAVRGGAWSDRPADAGSSVRRAYVPWQKVYNVGFRVIVESEN